MNSDVERDSEPSLREVAQVSIAALLPAFILWLTAPSSGDGPVIRFAFGVLGFWPSVTLGLVFAGLSLTKHCSNGRRWVAHAAAFSIVSIVGCLILWHNAVATARARPSSEEWIVESILTATVIAIGPAAAGRVIYWYLHRRWLAIEYALAVCFAVTVWATIVGPRWVVDL